MASRNGKRKRGESSEARRERELKLALVPMNVDYEELQPQIGLLTHILEQAAGGMAQVIRAMRLSPDAMIQEFLRHYDRASARQRRIVPFEAFALAARLNLMQLLGAVMVALREESVSLVKVITLTAHPTITRATVKSALREDGVADRKMLHTALGFLPIPKGAEIHLNLPVFPGPPDVAEDRLIPAEDIDMNEMFPDLMVTQAKMIPEPEEKK